MSCLNLRQRGSTSLQTLGVSIDENCLNLQHKQINSSSVQAFKAKEQLKKFQTMKKTEHICKICLVKEDDIKLLVSLCSCSGNLKYTHIDCFNLWISQQTKTYSGFKKIQKQGITCQICMNALHLKRNSTVRCKKPAEIYETLSQCDTVRITALFLIITCIGLIVAGAMLLRINTTGIIVTIMVAGMMGVGTVVLVIVGVYFVKTFMLVRNTIYDPN